MFKNESWIIREWMQHYIDEGIDHFYLIDNGSDDDYLIKIQDFIDKGLVTLVSDPYRQERGTQTLLYNKHYLETIKKETEWIIVVDIDEYIYGKDTTVKDYLKTVPEEISQIVLPWKIFGSNGLKEQPEEIVNSFIRREDYSNFLKRTINNQGGYSKSITRTKNLNHISVHPTVGDKITGIRTYSDFSPRIPEEYNVLTQKLFCNHYTHMSYEYFTKIKMIRGGGLGGVYDLGRFDFYDRFSNEVIDTELADKKRMTNIREVE